jgi:hypothetical protein
VENFAHLRGAVTAIHRDAEKKCSRKLERSRP